MKSAHSTRWIAVTVIALLAVLFGTPVRGEIEWAGLQHGEIRVSSIRNDDGVGGVRAVFAVTASRARIWEVLTDYENFQKVFPRIEKLVVLEETDSSATVEFWADAVVTELHYTLERTYVEPGHRLVWRRVSGDLERIDGSWRIVEGPDPGVHALVYESFVDVGIAIVTWIVRSGAEDEARKMAVRLRAWIEQN